MVLGISAFYHDSAAALTDGGRVVAAAQEERFSRRKGDDRFPIHAVRYCLDQAGIPAKDLEAVVFYDKPIRKFDRLVSSFLHRAPAGLPLFLSVLPSWFKTKLWTEEVIRSRLGLPKSVPVLFTLHHQSHAASAFYPSPFEEAAILTVDGTGEWTTTAIGRGSGTRVELLQTIDYPHSLGLLYSAFTYYCGFRVNSGEYKLMGLAPYGQPRYKDLIERELIHAHPDGSFTLEEKYFNYISGLRMISRRFERLFGRPALRPDQKPEDFHMDIAASIQRVLEDRMLALAERARTLTGARHLVLAGGVALNCVANEVILRSGLFDGVWIQPAAGDAGGALGAALAYEHLYRGRPRPHLGRSDGMSGALLGPEYPDAAIQTWLDSVGAVYRRLDRAELLKRAAQAIADGKVIGWVQGRMEYGPRALGNRSILGDPRNREMQSRMNLKVKFRESFRPFAPAVLAERAQEWFDLRAPDSPYMLLTAPVRAERRLPVHTEGLRGLDLLKLPRSQIPAVTHVDFSARVQTVHRDTNPLFHDLLQEFESLTGCPVVVNTSFNVRGEPIVCTPQDALRCFLMTNMDELFLGSFHIVRAEQDENVKRKAGTEEWKKSLIKD